MVSYKLEDDKKHQKIIVTIVDGVYSYGSDISCEIKRLINKELMSRGMVSRGWVVEDDTHLHFYYGVLTA